MLGGIYNLGETVLQDLGSDTACVLESHDHRTYTSLDRPISPSAVLSRDRVEPTPRGSDREAAATVYTPHAITVTAPLPAQPEDQGASVLDEEE